MAHPIQTAGNGSEGFTVEDPSMALVAVWPTLKKSTWPLSLAGLKGGQRPDDAIVRGEINFARTLVD